ncbi:D-sedoheptulose-7-phosphate isomerase [Streptomyces sp. enrichment culture]|uniref:D-sedoheptulose-7-phosphate isomerase n=1 Tax=Streptomyces sp. enrichment culture TaxID=1795815 RepID=UPI003F573E17
MSDFSLPEEFPDGLTDGLPDSARDGLPRGAHDGIPGGAHDGLPGGTYDGLPLAAREAARRHCAQLEDAVGRFRRDHLDVIARWGSRLAVVLQGGGRLLAAGNGGSAAQAQHLTAELVGRYRRERPAYSAISLHAETSSLTAIGNDYGFDQVYARQVAAHGRPGDVLLLLSTSGRSGNLIAAAATARSAGVRVWALTGPAPNPLAEAAHEALCVDAASTATVQETHLVAVHVLCECFDTAVETGPHRRTSGASGSLAPAAARRRMS